MSATTVSTNRFQIAPAHFALLGAATVASAGFAALHAPGHLAISAVAPVLAVMVAAFSSSLAGFAFSAIAGAFLFHLLPNPLEVVQIIMLCSVANQGLAVWSVRRNIDVPAMLPFLIPGLMGVPIGVYLLLHLNTGLYLQALGLGLAVWAIYQMVRKPVVRADASMLGDVYFGYVAGILGGFCGFAGAMISIRTGLKGWDKNRQRGVFQPCIFILQIAALVCIAVMRPQGSAALNLESLAYLPGSLLGTFLGLGVFKLMTDRQFFLVLNATLLVSGIALAV